jgi:hypothetical protein
MNRGLGLCLGLGIVCAAAASCGDPEQLYRHRDASAPGAAVGTGGFTATAGGFTATAGVGATAGTGASGSSVIGEGGAIAGGAGAVAGTFGGAGTGGGSGAAMGASGSGGVEGASADASTTGSGGVAASGSTSGASGSGAADASTDGMPACTSTPDCHCDDYGGHAYKFCGNGRGYADAAAACAMQGMRLIRIDDESENQWAFSNKVARGFPDVWIGADDLAAPGEWRWSDGTSFWMGKAGGAGAGPVSGLFNAWQASPSAEPDGQSGDDCAGYAYSTDRWGALPCTNHNAYICELY